MENVSDSPGADRDATAPRRSGRVVKAPSKFTADGAAQASASKRKRGDGDGDEEDVENGLFDHDDEMSDEPDDQSDDDHPAPRSRNPLSQGARARKPSSKKPKTNGVQPTSISRVPGIPSRPKKSVRIDAGEKGTGLFGERLRS